MINTQQYKKSAKLFWVLTVTVTVLPFIASGQAGYTLYNFSDIPQAQYLNPAYAPEAKVHVGLPVISSFYGGYENNAIPFSDAVTRNEDGNPELDMNYLAENAKPLNFFKMHLGIDLLNVGFRHKKNYFHFSARELISTEFVFPDNFVKLVAYGNAPFAGERLPMDDFSYQFTSYREYAFGWSRKWNDQWQVGARAKFLAGLENITTVSSSLGLYTNPENYHLTVDGSFDVRSSGINNLINTDFNLLDRIFNVQNRGAAVDLGAVYRHDDRWTFSASVTDLGFIRWTNDVRNYSMEDTSFTFRGLDLNRIVNDDGAVFDELADSLENTFAVNENRDAYTTMLSARFFGRAAYQYNEVHNFSALIHATAVGGKFDPALSLAWNARFFKFLGTSVSYNMYGRTFTNLGLGVNLMLGPVQLYAVTDNVLGYSGTSYSKNRHIRFGINFLFGRDKVKAADNENTD